jgi:hypothetical protein
MYNEAHNRLMQRAAERRKDIELGKQNKLFDYEVDVNHLDGSKFVLKHASLEHDHDEGVVFVYTEHNGALYFYLEDLHSYVVRDPYQKTVIRKWSNCQI